MNMSLLNSIPIPIPSNLAREQRLCITRVNIAPLFPKSNSTLLKSAWRTRLEAKLRSLDDLTLMNVIATTGCKLQRFLERVFKRAELMKGNFTLKQRRLGKRAKGADEANPLPLFRSSHHAYREYALCGDSRIFSETEADEEFWCNEIIDLATAILYFQRSTASTKLTKNKIQENKVCIRQAKNKKARKDKQQAIEFRQVASVVVEEEEQHNSGEDVDEKKKK